MAHIKEHEERGKGPSGVNTRDHAKMATNKGLVIYSDLTKKRKKQEVVLVNKRRNTPSFCVRFLPQPVHYFFAVDAVRSLDALRPS
jgi:hypothetical protein